MILLIRPAINEKINLGIPLGLMYISAVLKQHDFFVHILDYIVDDDINLEKMIRVIEPELVGISATYNFQVDNAIKLAKEIRSLDKKVLLVAGGNAASLMIEKFLQIFDIVVRGEGEFAFLEIAQGKKLSSIRGISYKGKGIIHTPPRDLINPLDQLPFPDYEDIDFKKYFNPTARIDFFNDTPKEKVSMITSRGCPMNCYFCSVHLQMGKIWRHHSVSYVLAHLKLLAEKYKIKHIDFEDDNLTLDPKRFEAILDGVKANRIKITWDTPNGVRVDTLNRRLLRKMKESGLTRLTIGIESGSQRVIDEVVHKNIKLTNVVEIAKICKEEKINLSAFYIIGMPGETKKDIETTLDFALMLLKKYDVIPKVSICAAMPGTEMTKICEAKGYLKNGRVNTEEFTAEDVDRYYNDFGKKVIIPYIKRINWITVGKNINKMPRVIGRFFISKKAQKV